MKAGEEPKDEAWVNFLRRHAKATLLMIIIGSLAAVEIISIFLWMVSSAQETGMVPAELGQWTVGYFITFALNLIFLELTMAGSWVVILALVIYFGWYKKLPEKERDEYEGKRAHRKAARDDSGFSFFVTLIWLGIVWLDGKWNLEFQSWTFNDWVYTWLTALFWGFLVVGILGLMYVIYTLATTRQPKKK